MHEKDDTAKIHSAIADAILFSTAISLKSKLADTQWPSIAHKEFGEIVALGTKNNCVDNSIISAIFLLENHTNLFKQCFIIETANDYGVFKRGNWPGHGGLVLLDVDKSWHYITPANHPFPPTGIKKILAKFLTSQTSNPLLTHLKENSLGSLVSEIERVETKSKTRIWPTEAEIDKEMANPKTRSCSMAIKDLDRLTTVSKVFPHRTEGYAHSYQVYLDGYRSFIKKMSSESFPELVVHSG